MTIRTIKLQRRFARMTLQNYDVTRQIDVPYLWCFNFKEPEHQEEQEPFDYDASQYHDETVRILKLIHWWSDFNIFTKLQYAAQETADYQAQDTTGYPEYQGQYASHRETQAIGAVEHSDSWAPLPQGLLPVKLLCLWCF